MRILLDTGIALRHIDEAQPLHNDVRSAIERLIAAGHSLIIANQVVYEFWVVATRPLAVNGLGRDPGRTNQDVSAMLGTFVRVPDPPDLLERWLDLCSRHQVCGRPAHDARLVAVMLAHGITHLLTLDPDDFARYPETTPVTPTEV